MKALRLRDGGKGERNIEVSIIIAGIRKKEHESDEKISIEMSELLNKRM